MFQLIYVSQACVAMDEARLRELLAQSREKNARLEITGMLLYQQGNFMQVLEGSREAVLSLMTSIRADVRHTNVVVIQEFYPPEREFPDWTMAFHQIDESTSRQPGFSDFLGTPLNGARFERDPRAARNLLLFFKQMTN
jgi:hypothetical protein